MWCYIFKNWLQLHCFCCNSSLQTITEISFSKLPLTYFILQLISEFCHKIPICISQSTLIREFFKSPTKIFNSEPVKSTINLQFLFRCMFVCCELDQWLINICISFAINYVFICCVLIQDLYRFCYILRQTEAISPIKFPKRSCMF